MSLKDSAELLTLIKQRGTVPVNSGSWDDTSILRTASEVIETYHLPLLVAARGEYLVKETQIPCVVSQREYLLNYRAAAIRLLSLTGRDNVERPLTEMSPSEQSTIYVDRGRTGKPLYFSFREGYVQLFPLPADVTDNLKVLWHIRPSRLDLVANCWQIFNIQVNTPSPGRTTIGFQTNAPTALAGISDQTQYDIVGVNNPYPIKAYDLTVRGNVTAGVTNNMVFASSELPTDLAGNDWICRPQYTAMPNIVSELHTAAALRTAAAIVGSRHSLMADALEKEAAGIENSLLRGILAPRSKGNPKRLVQRRWMRR